MYVVGLVIYGFGGCSIFFYEGGVLLCYFIYLGDGSVDFVGFGCLFMGCGRDFGDDVGYFFDVVDDFVECFVGFVD